MSDPEVINQAYEDNLQKIWANFLQSLIMAQDNPTAKKGAVQHFQNGVSLAREARDLAIASLPAASSKN